MKQIIYIDVLIAINLIVNYFLILAVSKFLYLKPKRSRIILGELLGGIYSLYILLPDSPVFIALTLKMLMAITIIVAVFGFKNVRVFIKALLYFYFMSFCFSGIMFAIWYLISPKGMAINNGVVYFNISPIMLIGLTLISYTLIELINRAVGQKESKEFIYDVCIDIGSKSAKLRAKVDTCNSLMEPFSNLPVIVASQDSLKDMFPIEFAYKSLCDEKVIRDLMNKNPNFRLRLIPFKTVLGEGMLPAFKPDSIKIKEGLQKEAYIAVCPAKLLPSDISALINPLLID